MGTAFQAMYEWSKTLDDGRVDESSDEITIGGGQQSRRVTNDICTVRGERGGTGVLAFYRAYHNTASATSMSTRYVPNVLELFVVDKGVRFSGVIRRRTFGEKLAAAFGLGKGIRPFRHELFTRYLALPEEKRSDACELDDRAFCDRLLELLASGGCWCVELQAKGGVSLCYRIPPQTLTPALLDDKLQAARRLLHPA